MTYYKSSVDKYRKKIKRYTITYNLSELDEAARLQSYLDDTGMTVNQYCKQLIKADLDKKGI